MNRTRCVSGIAALLGFCLTLPARPQGPIARPPALVCLSEASLAVRARPEAAWTLLHRGDRLPETCEVHASAVAGGSLELPGGEARLGPGTRLQLSAGGKNAVLLEGQLILKSASLGKIDAAGVTLRIEEPAMFEIVCDRQHDVALKVRAGSVGVQLPNAASPIVLPPESHWSWTIGESESALGPLDAKDATRIDAALADAHGQGLGQLVVSDPQSGSPMRLEIARYHAHVVLNPPVALVQIDQSFYNPYASQQEGTFVFNLPAGASVSRFAMYVTPQQLIEGEIIERERARTIYDRIVSGRQDPAILEQLGDNLFRMRVFPVPARDVKRVLLDFTLPLEAIDGRYRFELPLVSDLKPVWDFRLSGVIRGETPLESVVSRSHPQLAVAKQADGAIHLNFEESHHRPQGDFLLSFQPAEGVPALLRSYVAEPLPGRSGAARWDSAALGRQATLYFQASVPSENAVAQAPPVDVLILVDTSSGTVDKRALRRVAAQAIRHLRPQDRFRVGCVDVSARFVDQDWSPGEPARIEERLQALRQELFLGGTDLVGSFRQALETAFDKADPARRRLVLYVGDGRDTMSNLPVHAGQEELRTRFEDHRAALIGLYVGKHDPSEDLLRTVAESTGGLVFDLLGDGRQQQDYFAWLLAGMPSPRRVVGVDAKDVAVDDLFVDTRSWLPGRPLSILGRLADAAEVRLRIATAAAGEKPQTRELTIAVDPRQDDVFIGRLWAQRRLDELRRQSATATQAANELKREIITLSQEWSLLSPHTAFLVLESEQDYRRWNVDRLARRRYWKPADRLPQSPLPADWLKLVSRPVEKAPDADTQRKQFEQALQQIREALAGGNASLAYRLVQQAKRLPPAAESDELAALARQALAETERQTLLDALGQHRALFEPAGGALASPLRPQLMSLFAPKISAEFLEHRPYTLKLLQEIRLPTGDRDLRDLAATLTNRTGLTVDLDTRALEDIGLKPTTSLKAQAWGRLTIDHYLRIALKSHSLTSVFDNDRLLITSVDEAGQRLDTRIYPVSDLLFTERVASPGLLADPLLDHDDAVARRLRAKLKQPSQLDERRVRLGRLIEQVAEALGEAAVLDTKALDDAGVGADTLVTANWPKASFANALQWMLEPLELVYTTDRGALFITTRDEAGQRLITRLHSGRGVIYTSDGRPNDWGFGGAVGGGGGFGGGLGGGGGAFGGGGFGGAPAVISVIPVQDGVNQAGISQGGDAPIAPAPKAWDEVGGPGTIEPFETSLSLAISQTQAVGGYEADFDSVIDRITSIVAPTTWDQVGGPGAVAVFPHTLDFIISQTDDVHPQIESLLEKLRKMPPAFSTKTGLRLADIRKTGPDDLNVDSDLFVDLLTSTLAPTTWDQVGGVGSLDMDIPRLAMIVSQTEEVHDQIHTLLTQLRRSRYAQLRSDRPWESNAARPDLPRLLPATDWNSNARFSALPPPREGELAALAVRRVATPWEAAWRFVPADGSPATSLRASAQEQRLQWQTDTLQVRTEYDAAVLAYPGLRLIERGPWAEPARRWLDAALPWLPHRSNEELARLFDVISLAEAPAEGQKRVQLVPPGFEGSQCRIELALEQTTGRLITWEAYRSDLLASRLRFEYGADSLPQSPRLVTAEDGQGRELGRWELLEARAEAEVPPLDKGWDRYVDSASATFGKVSELLKSQQWKEAAEALRSAADKDQKQPLVDFLRAWCAEHDPEIMPHAELVKTLEEIASGQAVDLTRLIAAGSFSQLSSAELYAILQRQPEDSRSPQDWDQLARAALAAGQVPAALSHLNRGGASTDFPRIRLRVELLLRLKRFEESVAAARAWTTRPSTSVAEIGSLTELLLDYGQNTAADTVLEAGRHDRNWPPAARSDLLRRRALLQSGLARLRLLLEAATLLPTRTKERAGAIDAVMGELSQPQHAELAAVLAGEATAMDVRAALLGRQAELLRRPAEAAQIGWRLYELDRLPRARLPWLCGISNQVGQSDRVIRELESLLRKDVSLSDAALFELAAAYRITGRRPDARRAGTHLLDQSPPEPSPAASSSLSGSGFF